MCALCLPLTHCFSRASFEQLYPSNARSTLECIRLCGGEAQKRLVYVSTAGCLVPELECHTHPRAHQHTSRLTRLLLCSTLTCSQGCFRGPHRRLSSPGSTVSVAWCGLPLSIYLSIYLSLSLSLFMSSLVSVRSLSVCACVCWCASLSLSLSLCLPYCFTGLFSFLFVLVFCHTIQAHRTSVRLQAHR